MRTVRIFDWLWHRHGAGPSAAFLAIVLVATLGTSARAGSIFDDNWTPPKATERPKQPVPAPPANTTTAPTPAPTPTPDTPQPKPATPVPNPPPNVTPPPVETPVLVVPAAPTKHPIPAKADLTRSRKLLREAYADLLKDKSFKARRSLVQTLLEESDKSGNNPSDQFALLAGAIDAAKEGESLRLCLTAADKLSEIFDVDGLKVKTQAATSMILKAPMPADTVENIRADLELADQLVAAEDFAGAARVVALARPLASDNPELRAQVLKRSQSIELARSAFDQIQPFLDKLKTAPNDGPANLALGGHYCLKMGQWDKGLPYLAKSSDPKYRELATSELAATSEPANALTLAAGWWDRAEEKGTSDADAKAIKLHAATWYRFGQSSASGLAAKVVEVRLNQAALLGYSGGNNPVSASASITPHAIGHKGPPGTIDLLRLIDLKKDVIEGAFAMTGDGLKAELNDKDGRGRIRIPYDPPPEYDLNIEMTRLKRGPNQFFLIAGLNNDEHYLIILAENDRTIRISGSNEPGAVRTDTGPVFVDNQRCKIHLEVRKDRMAVFVDGKLGASCAVTPGQGDNNRSWWIGDHVLGLAGWCSYVIHSMKVVEIGQSGSVMALGPAYGIPTLPAPAPADVPTRVVNLMPLIDVVRDSNEGTWERTPSGGIMSSTGARSRIRIPYQAPEEYDFRIAFHRIDNEGWIGQTGPIAGKSFMYLMAASGNCTTGFEHIAGKGFESNATTVRSPNFLQSGRQYTSVVHVRRGRLSASIDGKLVVDYKTNGSDVSIAGGWMVGENILGIAAEGSHVQFDAIEIREIRGHGKAVAHPELPSLSKSPPNDPAQRTVDLMPLINPEVDTIAGRWSRVNKTMIASDGSAARLRIPYHPPEEYDYHVRVRRMRGTQFVALLMSHGLHNFDWIMGWADNRICGLELVDGRRADNNPTMVKSDSVFQSGRTVDIVTYVRNGSVSVSVDGKLVLEHKTDFHDLTSPTEAYIGDSAIGLYANSNAVEVDVIEIREITGEGKPSPRGQ